MSYKQVPLSFFVGDKYLGRGIARPPARGTPSHYAWFCPQCGEIWARAVVELPGIEWQTYRVLCPRHQHPGWFTVPGSIWQMLDTELNDALPPAALQREFTIHLNHFDTHAYPNQDNS